MPRDRWPQGSSLHAEDHDCHQGTGRHPGNRRALPADSRPADLSALHERPGIGRRSASLPNRSLATRSNLCAPVLDRYLWADQGRGRNRALPPNRGSPVSAGVHGRRARRCRWREQRRRSRSMPGQGLPASPRVRSKSIKRWSLGCVPFTDMSIAKSAVCASLSVDFCCCSASLTESDDRRIDAGARTDGLPLFAIEARTNGELHAMVSARDTHG